MEDNDDPFDGDEEDTSASMYLAFRVGSAEYALPVLMVTEIVRLPTWHPLPDVPPHICGVVNLRSRVVPIMDLRMRFGLAPTKPQSAPSSSPSRSIALRPVCSSMASAMWSS